MSDPSHEAKHSVWCGNLSSKVTEDILYELFLQAGPIVKVTIPKDQQGHTRGYGFILFVHVPSVNYAVSLLDDIPLFDRRIQVKRRNYASDDPSETTMPQEFTLNVNALTPLHQPFNLSALTPVDHSFMLMPPPNAMPFGSSMFNINPLGNTTAYPSQMGDNSFNQHNFNQGFNNNWNNFHQNRNNRNYNGNFERNYDRNQERNYDRSNERGGNRDFQRNHDQGFSRGDRGHNRNHDRSYDRNDRSDKNADRNFDRNRNRPDRELDDRNSGNKHSSRDYPRNRDRGNQSSGRSSGQSREREYSSSDASHSKRKRY